MIFIKNEEVYIKRPSDAEQLLTSIKNALRKDLEKGHSIFEVPARFDDPDVERKDQKSNKQIYKIGFLFDLMGIIYPEYGKEKKFEIIMEKYHFWLSYRQFKTLLDIYEGNREKYYQ